MNDWLVAPEDTCAGDEPAFVPRRRPRPPLAVVLEGRHDAAFFLTMATLWRTVDPTLPDLAHLVAQGRLLLLPIGGGGASDLLRWGQALAALGWPRFHLHDREQEPETSQRRAAIAALNRQPNCVARLTVKRSLENYLHPAALVAAGLPAVEFGDHEDVATLVAQARHAASTSQLPWQDLSYRSRRRLASRAKRRLHAAALPRMTVAWAHERDPAGEVRGWFRALAELREW